MGVFEIVAKHPIMVAVGVDTQGNQHVLDRTPGSSANAKVVMDLLSDLALRGIDLKILIKILRPAARLLNKAAWCLRPPT